MLRLVARFAALRLADSMPILRACALVRGFFRRARSADPSEISIPQFGQWQGFIGVRKRMPLLGSFCVDESDARFAFYLRPNLSQSSDIGAVWPSTVTMRFNRVLRFCSLRVAHRQLLGE